MPAESSWARFDDLVDNTALAFPTPSETLVARHVAEVAPVLEAVDRATRAGRWAVGFVSYAAASGLDDALITAAPEPDGLPLAWAQFIAHGDGGCTTCIPGIPTQSDKTKEKVAT